MDNDAVQRVMESQRVNYDARIRELEQRIRKAREILEDYYKCQGRPMEIEQALEALEGK